MSKSLSDMMLDYYRDVTGLPNASLSDAMLAAFTDGGGGLNFKGNWDAGTTYNKGQAVNANKGLYVARSKSVGVDPTLPAYGPQGDQGSVILPGHSVGYDSWVTSQFTTDQGIYLTDISGYVPFGPGGTLAITATKDGTVLFTATTAAVAPGGTGATISAPVTAPGVLPAGTYWMVQDRGTAVNTQQVVGSNAAPTLNGHVSAVASAVYTGTANGVHNTVLNNYRLEFTLKGKLVLLSPTWDLVVQGV